MVVQPGSGVCQPESPVKWLIFQAYSNTFNQTEFILV